MLAETGDIAVADAAGDARYRQTRGTKQFSSLFQADLLQVALEADAVMLPEHTRQVAGAGEGDPPRHLGQT